MRLNEGIIVKSLKYQETSKIITIINEEELATYFVKGGANFKSRNFSYSNELTKIGYDFSQKTKDSLKILTTGTIIDNYSSIKQPITSNNQCQLILPILCRITTPCKIMPLLHYNMVITHRQYRYNHL